MAPPNRFTGEWFLQIDSLRSIELTVARVKIIITGGNPVSYAHRFEKINTDEPE